MKMRVSCLVWRAYEQARNASGLGYNILYPYELVAYGIITPAEVRDSAAFQTVKVSRPN